LGILKRNEIFSTKTLLSSLLTFCPVNLNHKSLFSSENSGRIYILKICFSSESLANYLYWLKLAIETPSNATTTPIKHLSESFKKKIGAWFLLLWNLGLKIRIKMMKIEVRDSFSVALFKGVA
jgi:hypothetical protein